MLIPILLLFGAEFTRGDEPCRSFLSDQVESGLKQFSGRKANRSVAVDISFPPDQEHFERLNRMVIVGMAVFSRDQRDLPVHSVVFVPASGSGEKQVVVLPPVLKSRMVRVLPDSDPAHLAFGRHRENYYAFLPARYLQEPGKLVVRFSRRVAELPAMTLPLRQNLPQYAALREDPKKIPERALALAMVRGNYCESD